MCSENFCPARAVSHKRIFKNTSISQPTRIFLISPTPQSSGFRPYQETQCSTFLLVEINAPFPSQGGCRAAHHLESSPRRTISLLVRAVRPFELSSKDIFLHHHPAWLAIICVLRSMSLNLPDAWRLNMVVGPRS